jgi:type II secretory pathway pseudopilin PulG
MRRLLKRESGFTLIEMVITMSLLILIVTFVTRGFASVQSGVAGADIRLQNLQEARVLMATVTKDIRTATYVQAGSLQAPFTIATPTQVRFTANLLTTGAPNQVDIWVDRTIPSAPVLKEKITTPNTPILYPPGPVYCAACGAVRFVGTYVVNTDTPSGALFTYFDKSNVAIGLPGDTLTALQMLQIEAVGINLQVRKSTIRSMPFTTLTGRVSLPNVYYSVSATPTP